MNFEATFELTVPKLECNYALQNPSLQNIFELTIPELECTFKLS